MGLDDLERRRALDRAQWSDGREHDPQASVVLRGHPLLTLASHVELLRRYRDAPDALTEVRDSPGAGQGLFAATAIDAGERVGEYVGEIVVPELPLSHDLMTYHPYDSSIPYAIDASAAGNHTRFINHSRFPNSGAWWLHWDEDWHVVLVTLRSVSAGEELLLDYGPEYLSLRDEHPRP